MWGRVPPTPIPISSAPRSHRKLRSPQEYAHRDRSRVKFSFCGPPRVGTRPVFSPLRHALRHRSSKRSSSGCFPRLRDFAASDPPCSELRGPGAPSPLTSLALSVSCAPPCSSVRFSVFGFLPAPHSFPHSGCRVVAGGWRGARGAIKSRNTQHATQPTATRHTHGHRAQSRTRVAARRISPARRRRSPSYRVLATITVSSSSSAS